MALLVWAAFTLDGRDPEVYRGALLGVSLAGALAVVGASQDDGGWFGRVLGWRPLGVLGLLSYGIYLAHWPILLAVQHWSHLGPWATTAVVAPLTVAVAAASYLVVEHPVRLRRGVAWSRPALLPVLAAGCVVAAVAGTVGARPGLRSVDERSLLAALPAAEPSTSTRVDRGSGHRAIDDGGAGRDAAAADDRAPPDGGGPRRPSPRPRHPPRSRPPRWPPPSRPRRRRHRWPPRWPAPPVARRGCYGRRLGRLLPAPPPSPPWGSARPSTSRSAPPPVAPPTSSGRPIAIGPATKQEPSLCPTIVQRWPRDVERFQPDLVLLLYGGFVNGWLVDGQPVDACDPAYRAHYGALLDGAIDTLTAGGARLVVALPAYHRVYGVVEAADAAVDCLTATYTDAVARHADRAADPALRPVRLPDQGHLRLDAGRRPPAALRRPPLPGAAARLASQWILDQLVQPAA